MSPRAAQANARVPPHSGHGSPVIVRNGHGGISGDAVARDHRADRERHAADGQQEGSFAACVRH